MKKRLHSLAGRLPLVGEFHVEFGSCLRGRAWADCNVSRKNVELFLGDTHVVCSMDQKGLPIVASFIYLVGWVLDPAQFFLAAAVIP